ncbi:MAG: hypothetical protein WBF81_03700 [Thermoplasmata archaeon]
MKRSPGSEVVFLRDEGVFDAPIAEVWRLLGSGAEHERSHRHREVRREVAGENSGVYSWVQPFRGAPVRFAMRWTAFVPLGLAYEVLEGPFSGSRFFLSYRPDGTRTEVSVVGAFTSPTLPAPELRRAVLGFFATEFGQDAAALRRSRDAPSRGARAPAHRRRTQALPGELDPGTLPGS